MGCHRKDKPSSSNPFSRMLQANYLFTFPGSQALPVELLSEALPPANPELL